jgi:hypothetical protein
MLKLPPRNRTTIQRIADEKIATAYIAEPQLTAKARYSGIAPRQLDPQLDYPQTSPNTPPCAESECREEELQNDSLRMEGESRT